MTTPTRDLDLSAGYDLAPQVSVRPESFGALLYHFGTRRLSFLKDPVLLAVVQQLALQPTAGAALDAAGIGAADRARYARALATLAGTDMLVPRSAATQETA